MASPKEYDASAPSSTLFNGTQDPPREDETVVQPAGLPEPDAGAQGFATRYGEPHAVLGVGGMGEVRAVRDHWIGRLVAMKTLRGELVGRSESRMRFLREVRVQGQLEHPSIVPVYDVGVTSDEEPFFTMRRVGGLTLSKVVQALAAGDADLAARFSRRKLLTAFSSICMAVHYAHTRGVVHRDLKPSNVIFGEFGEVYMIDWGIAKVMATPDNDDSLDIEETSTGSGRIMGTLGYMAPEQVSGRAVDPRTDVYALGVILFEILTLTNLVRETNPRKALLLLERGIIAHPSKAAPHADIPPELDSICLRATSFEPSDRFQSAKDLSEAVERYLDGDRDAARRRELAAELLQRAETMLEQSGPNLETDPDAAMATRIAALRETLRAVALDPGHEHATALLGRLVLEVPDRLPRAAQREREVLRQEERVHGASLGFRGFLSYLAAFPLMAIAGIRSVAMVGAGLAATLAALVYARWVEKEKRASSRDFYILLAICVVIVVLQSTWLGPFVLTPVAATLTASMFALYARGRERLVVIAGGAAMVLLPAIAELIPGIEHAIEFRDNALVLKARALELPPTMTAVGLVYTTVGFALLPSVFLFRLRDKLRGAEDRTFLQAWTLTQLFPSSSRQPQKKSPRDAPPARGDRGDGAREAP